MHEHHTIISGTGRAGTTFLVQLLTELGVDTGFGKGAAAGTATRGGLEVDDYGEGAPYLIKGPRLCDMLDGLITRGEMAVDHAIVPVRDLFAAAESRRVATREHRDLKSRLLRRQTVPGGLWQAATPKDQESVLTEKLYNLILACAKHDVPVTLLHFPRLTQDPRYVYDKLQFLFPDVAYESFETVFHQISHPEFVHDYAPRSR